MFYSRNWRMATAAMGLAAIISSLAPAMAAAQSTAPPDSAPPEPATAPSESSPPPEDEMNGMLGGPQLPDTVVHTLVRLDAQGRFQRIEGRPEEAALSLLNLDAEMREQARQAAAARRETLRAFLLENLDLIIASTDAQEAGDAEKARSILRQMRDRFDPSHERDPVLKPLASVLSADQHDQLQELLNDYWTACLDWEMRSSKDKSDAARQKVQDRLTFEMFQQEYRQAYDRTLRPYRAKFESIVQATQPTDEQKAAIRKIIQDYIRAGRLEPTLEQQREAARQIYQALDDERRMKLFEVAFNRL